jgi:hypothetical protein
MPIGEADEILKLWRSGSTCPQARFLGLRGFDIFKRFRGRLKTENFVVCRWNVILLRNFLSKFKNALA